MLSLATFLSVLYEFKPGQLNDGFVNGSFTEASNGLRLFCSLQLMKRQFILVWKKTVNTQQK